MSSEPDSAEGAESAKRGRKPDPITAHFNRDQSKPKLHNRYWWRCKHCKTSILHRDFNLQQHILQKCREVKADARKKEMERINDENRPLTKKQRSLAGGSAHGQGNLSGFMDPPMPAALAQQVSQELLRLCATGGIYAAEALARPSGPVQSYDIEALHGLLRSMQQQQQQ